jgi:23S rRNA (cytosine1962-C5)-methyltransferase
MGTLDTTLPFMLLEDEHLLVIDKPPGISTHAPGPYTSLGIHEWLRRRAPRFAALSILHRLDKETSGVLVFGKTRRANQSLASQFESRTVRKRYVLLSLHDPGPEPRTVRSTGAMDRGEAETSFRRIGIRGDAFLIEASPSTGRTHQIRRHAAQAGFPVLGDAEYGGAPFRRVCLHAEELEITHPQSGQLLMLRAPHDFETDPAVVLCRALWPEPASDAWRLCHGSSSSEPGWYVDRLGAYLLSLSEEPPDASRRERLERWRSELGLRGVYHKRLDRRVGDSATDDASPVLIGGNPAPDRFVVHENNVRYLMSFIEGYSTGLFLDQRDNRAILGSGDVLGGSLVGATLLNTFAYTCAFSVSAALAGATVTSLDLSKKSLDWGRENFVENGLDPAAHDFIFGDCFDWMRRLENKGRRFDTVLLDPPTFSRSKQTGVFRAEKDYGRLVTAALPLLMPGGLLFCSTNSARFDPEDFLDKVRGAVVGAGREIESEDFCGQPPDFATSPGEPPYLKTVWLRVR